MNSRIPLIVAVLLAMFALGFAGSRLVSSVPQSPAPAHASLPPALASYLAPSSPGRRPTTVQWPASHGRQIDSRTSSAITAAGPSPLTRRLQECFKRMAPSRSFRSIRPPPR